MKIPVIINIHPVYLQKLLKDKGLCSEIYDQCIVSPNVLYIVPSLLTVSAIVLPDTAHLLFITNHSELSFFDKHLFSFYTVKTLSEFKPKPINTKDLKPLNLEVPIDKLEALNFFKTTVDNILGEDDD